MRAIKFLKVFQSDSLFVNDVRITVLILCGFLVAACSIERAGVISAAEIKNTSAPAVITPGMSAPEVSRLLGKPTLVRRDSSGNEVWIYDGLTLEAADNSSGEFIRKSSSTGTGIPRGSRTVVVRITADNRKVKAVSYFNNKY
ncbi:MAG: hypothetical protein D6719_11305 [Candidatus Dadabacteria bacterium]|nr:MAG: hypothetical protein D6719_11305 [Candidatus Dadabacteria bacterium]